MEDPSPVDRPRRTLFQRLRIRFRRLKGALRPESNSHQQLQRPKSSFGTGLISRLTCCSLPDSASPVDPGPEQYLGTATPPEPPTQASDPNIETDPISQNNESGSAAWARMIGSLRVLETTVEFPPLKSAVGAFIGCLDIVQKAASNRPDYEELADEFESIVNILNQYAGDLESEPNSGSIANIVQCLERQVTEIKDKEALGTIGHLLDVTHDQEHVIRRYREVERLFRKLQCDLSTRTRNNVEKQLEVRIDSLILAVLRLTSRV
ncbi:unnamed protein product [Rhizoctonia solani]|uniref:Uncharacterized protein n=1 Tax=Rhizoctonia solani TaxID=456999 RepID=A0A8H3HLJ7_9AGAM|nr:unnamed protein product [Rhizoctonia solani]